MSMELNNIIERIKIHVESNKPKIEEIKNSEIRRKQKLQIQREKVRGNIEIAELKKTNLQLIEENTSLKCQIQKNTNQLEHSAQTTHESLSKKLEDKIATIEFWKRVTGINWNVRNPNGTNGYIMNPVNRYLKPFHCKEEFGHPLLEEQMYAEMKKAGEENFDKLLE